MGNLLFLLLAVAVAALGIAALWLRGRAPRSVHSGVDDFSARMNALAPDQRTPPRSEPDGGSASDPSSRGG